MAKSITDPRLLDYEPDTGDTVWFHSDPTGTEYVVERVSDVEPLVEFNKAVINKDHGRWGDGKIVAQWPPVVTAELMRKGIWGDQERMRAWLNDRDNSVWRVRPGRV